LPDGEGLTALKEFLGRTAKTLGEKCLYVEVAGEGILLYDSGTNADAGGLCV